MLRKVLYTYIFVFILAMCMSIPCSAEQVQPNLLQNSSFEEVQYGMPISWSLDIWNKAAEATKSSVETSEPHSGSSVALLENKLPNDAKWVQTVKVKPKTTYRLSGWVRADNVGSGAKGANVSVLGIVDTSKDIKGTNTNWQLLELYGTTGASQEELQIAVRLGGYGSLNTGKAFFDDIALEEAPKPPNGVKVISLEPGQSAPAPQTADNSEVSGLPVVFQAALFAAIFALITIWGIRQRGEAALTRGDRIFWTILLFGSGLALRLLIAVKAHGHPADMNTFMAWAAHATERGLPNFYTEDMFADYPPGYIYVLYVIGWLAELLGLSPGGWGIRLLIKLPAVVADMVTAMLLLRYGRRYLGERAAAALAALYLINPGVWVNSAAWGQVDSVFTLVLLVSLLLLTKNRPYQAAVWFALTVLIKPQALIFTPVFLFKMVAGREWRKLTIAVVWGVAVFTLLVIPFSLHKPAGWIFSLYQTTLASYPYASLNAFNAFTLIGGNWEPSDKHFLFLSYQAWGMALIVMAVAAAAYLFFRKRGTGEAKVFLTALLLIVWVFVFGIKMHERYLFPAVALSLFAYLFSRDRRVLLIHFGLSITQFINVAYVLAYGMKGQFVVPRLDGVLLMVSAANVLLLAFLLRVGYDLLVKGRVIPVTQIGEEEEDPLHASETETGDSNNVKTGINDIKTGDEQTARSSVSRKLMNRKDWIVLGILMAVYSVLALYHLGSFKAPQTYWEPERTGQTVQFEFDRPLELARMNSFGGVGDGKFRIEFSTDEQSWDSAVSIDQNYTKDFFWITSDLNVTARYARLTVESTGFMTHEIAFYEKGSETPAVTAVTGDHAGEGGQKDPKRLVDEPGKAVYKPSYMYSTYFDEIYHARTAFEHLHGIKPYENTHPPLGKLFIAVGIWLFGMDPFGWRIVGTLFGIAMIPLMYLFGKRLFGRTEWAFLSAFLFTFDFMHFAQTRISTIDVYGVFFIILMFYFMYQFYTSSFYEQTLRQTLRPLFWSGFLFGIGAASKWIVIYGGAGLALLFALTLYDRYTEYAAAKKALASGSKGKGQRAEWLDVCRRRVELFPKRTLQTVLWCIPFFVIIPAIVYSLSFLPALTSHGETLSFKRLIEYQTSMYDYHSKLKATHSFASTWYEWPVMVKPIWFYAGQFVGAGNKSSIVSMGNPAIWWPGILAVLLAIKHAIQRKDKGMLVVLIAFFSQYVPWMLVQRLTFIYHFFAMVPFLVLCIVYVLKIWREKHEHAQKWIYAYMGLVLVLFAMFYPVLSGLEVSKWYIDYVLRWFPGWYF